MSPTPIAPEVHWTKPSSHAPNSDLPILIYRGVLPQASTAQEKRQALEANGWVTGGTWGHISRPHYHSNTHECYAPISGWSRCLYGVGPQDDPNDGVAFVLNTGDVAVHAAGVEHRNVESSEDYRYLALYPKDAPRWDSVYGELSTADKLTKVENARRCSIPDDDPVYGINGPLAKLWRRVDSAICSTIL